MTQISARFSAPATHRQAVVFCCDADYLSDALHAADQIAGLSPNRTFDICLASIDGWPQPKSLEHCGIRYLQICTGGAFADLRHNAHRIARYLNGFPTDVTVR